MPFVQRQLSVEMAELEAIAQALETLSQSPQDRTQRPGKWRQLPRWIRHLKIMLETLNPAELETDPKKLQQCIHDNAQAMLACLYGDDQTSLVLGAYFSNDGKLYSLESVYKHLICSTERDRSPLVSAFQKVWSVTPAEGIIRLLRFFKRHAITLPEPDRCFWQNWGIEPFQGDVLSLLPYALHTSLKTQLTALQERAIESSRIASQDDLSQKLITWTTVFLRTLALVRDKQGDLRTNREELHFLQDFLALQPGNQRTLPEKIDEWVVLECYSDFLYYDLLLDPYTRFPLNEHAVMLNDEQAHTVNRATAELLRSRHSDLETNPHPALSTFLAWKQPYDSHLNAMRIHRRHLAAREREQHTDAYAHAHNRILLDTLQQQMRFAIGTVRQDMQQKLDAIEQSMQATDERVTQWSEQMQQTDARVQTLKAQMDECSRLWDALLQELLPRLDADIEQGIADAKAMQQRVQDIKDQAERIQQQLTCEIQTHKREHARLNQALSILSDDVRGVADQHLLIEKDIVRLRQQIAETQRGFFGKIAMAAGVIMGTVLGCGVGSILLKAGYSAMTAGLGGGVTSAATSAFFAMAADVEPNKSRGSGWQYA